MNRCLSCGLQTKHHRGRRNETLSCAEAARQHPRAVARRRSFRSLLAMSVNRASKTSSAVIRSR